MKYDITLNFLPLNTSNFNFEIYRKQALTEEKLWSDSIRKYWIDDKQYWVSFTEFEQAEKVEVNTQKLPLGLVNRYLHLLLSNNLNKAKVKIIDKQIKFKSNRIYIHLDTIKSANGTIIGEKAVWIEPYYLKTTNQYGFLLDYKFLRNKEYPFNREVQKYSLSLDANYRENRNYHIDKYEIIKSFIQTFIVQIQNLTAELTISKKLQIIEADTLKTKKYIFNNNNTHNSQFNGVMEYGPYEEVKKAPFYYYVYKEEHRPFARDLLNALNGSFFTFKGVEKLHLHRQDKDNTKGIIINDFSIDEINRKIDEIKKTGKENPIIIAVTPKKEETFYYQLKNKCLEENIPVQTVHIETISNSNKLKWSVSGIAVQIFSKLSGVPWIVEPSNKNTLIVGVGQAHKFNKVEEKIDRYFSYSVLINSSGKFMSIKQLADETDKTKFIESITKNISEIIQDNKEYKKIIFHIPQKINKEEIKLIEDELTKWDDDIELSIIKVNDKSDFIGFNLDKNSLVPYESSFVKISDREYLIWTEGLNFHNSKALKRYGHPLHITFYYSNKEVNFNKHKVYLQDILNLSGANYRGFNAKSLPVSSFYPKLIADFSKHFKELNLKLTTKDTEKPWFL
jgi:vacuolar-type H+-ATPase subunit F/Vma7